MPFVNINNEIYDFFGDFEFKHHGTVLIGSLLACTEVKNEPICFAYVRPEEFDLVIIQQKKLLFFNSFSYKTPEDFLYYLLFTMEQLQLDTGETKVRVFGTVEEGDRLFDLCQEYIQHLSVYLPAFPGGLSGEGVSLQDNYLEIHAL